MELLKKISKRYLSLSFSMPMAIVMALGVGSCKCGGEGDKNNIGNPRNPSISFEQDALIGNDKTTHLTVGGFPYIPVDFKIKVSVTNGNIKIGGVTFIGEEVKPLNEVLEINANDKVEEKKSVKVEVTPTDPTIELKATVAIIDSKGDKMGSPITFTWTPEVPTGLEGEISEIVNGKITVTVTAKENGKKVDIKAGDVQDLEVKVTSNQNTAVGESATIVEVGNTGKLQLQGADIKNGVITKELTVTPGTKATDLTIVVTWGGDDIGNKKVSVPAAGTYVLELSTNKIDNGDTEVTITVKKGGKVMVATELEDLQVRITRVSGSNGTLEDQAGGKFELKGPKVLTMAGDTKSASRKLTIKPLGDKTAKFDVELLDKKGTLQGVKQTLEWENGAALTMVIAYDATTKKVEATVTNSGKKKLGANEAKLTWDTGHNDVTISGNKLSPVPVNVPEVTVGNNTVVDLGTVVFGVLGAVTQMTVTLQWDPLPSDKVEKTALAENAHVITALNAKNAVDTIKGAIDTEVTTNSNLVAAKVEYDKLDGELQKITDAQTAVGGDGKVVAIDNALAAATLVVTAGKQVYDDKLAAQITLATDAEGKVVNLRIEIVVKAQFRNLSQAKIEYDKLDGELQKITDAQAAVGRPGKVPEIDTAFNNARGNAATAKLEYDDAKTIVDTQTAVATAAKAEIGNLVIAIGTEVVKPGLGTAKASYDKLDGELQKIKGAQTAVGGPGKVIVIDDAVRDATLTVATGKQVYDDAIAQTTIATTAKAEIDRLKGEIKKEVVKPGLGTAKASYNKLDGELQKIKGAQTAVGGPDKVIVIDDAVRDATLAVATSKQVYDDVIAAQTTIARDAKDKVGNLRIEIVVKARLRNLSQAKIEYDQLDGELQKITDAQAAVGGPGKVPQIDTAFNNARGNAATAKLEYDNAKTIVDTQTAIATDAKAEIDRLKGEIKKEVVKPGLGNAKVEYDKLDGELQKITDAQLTVGGNGKVAAIDTALAAARLQVTAGKKVYDDAALLVAAQTTIATTAKIEIDRLKGEIKKEVVKPGLGNAKAEYDKLGVELKKITAAQTAVGGNGKVGAIDAALTAATAVMADGKKVYDDVITAQSAIATTAKAEIDKFEAEVNKEVGNNDQAKAKTAYDNIGVELQKILNAYAVVGGAGKVNAIDGAVKAAWDSIKNAKIAGNSKGWGWK